jgi:AcrR family transcriptional regulator
MARPSKPLISRSNAAQAALDAIDELGLEKLSLAQVADRLGVQPPSLYYHFKNKSELLQEVARVMLVRIPPMPNHHESYEERIIALCIGTRRALLKHPNAALLILSYFPKYMLLAAYDRAASEEPFPGIIQMTVIEAIEKFTYGASLFEAAAHARGVKPMPDFDKDKFPALARALAENPFDDEELFVEALRMFLLGARERVRTGTVGKPFD